MSFSWPRFVAVALFMNTRHTYIMSKYTASFADLNNKVYDITITTSTGSVNKTLTLGGSPLIINGGDSGDNLYEPVKPTGVTVTIITDSLVTDLYSGSALGTKVEVKSGSSIVWIGYLTPCAYSQGYDNPLEELELECVDGLSVLQDLPYVSAAKEISPFINILYTALKQANCYKYLYISDTLSLASGNAEAICDKIRVSEGNFFEEKDYELQPDGEVAMSCFDVLSEVCQYLGLTATAYGDSVYLIDYDGIRAGKNGYYRYDISGASATGRTAVTLNQSYHIKDGSYAENGAHVDLTPVYNKLTVKDDFYTIEAVNDGMDNSKNYTNITASDDPNLRAKIAQLGEGPYLHVDVVEAKNGKNDMERMELCTFRSLTSGDDRGWYHFNIFKFFSNPMIKTYHYSLSSNTRMTNSYFDNDMNYYRMWQSKGANVVGNFQQVFDAWEFVLSGWAQTYKNTKWATMTDKEKLDAYAELLKMKNIESKKLTNYIVCNNPSESHIAHDKVRNFPYFTISKNIPSVFGGVNGYIVISGSVLRHTWDNCLFPHYEKVTEEIKEQNCSIYKNEAWMWCQLKWGNQYWKEEGDSPTLKGEWVTTPAYFKLYYGDPTKETKLKDWYNKDLPFYNTCKLIWGETSESGYYIPAPDEENLAGNIELTFYANKDTKGKKDRRGKKDKKNSYDAYPPRTMLYKDIDIKLCFADDALNEDAAKEDTIYTNEVTGYKNITEGDEVSCKICTFDDKTPSYSTVDYLDSAGKSQYVDTLYNSAYDLALRAEEHIIYKRVNQSCEPRVKFKAALKYSLNLAPYCTLTDKTISGKTFVIDTYNVDVRMNKVEVNLVEKSNRYN